MPLLTDSLSTGTLSSNKSSPQKSDVTQAPSDFLETLDDVFTSGEGCSVAPDNEVRPSAEADSAETVSIEAMVDTDLDVEVNTLALDVNSAVPDGLAQAIDSVGLPSDFNTAGGKEALTLSMIQAGLKANGAGSVDSTANASQVMTATKISAATAQLSSNSGFGDNAFASFESELLDELSTRPERPLQTEPARASAEPRILERPLTLLNSVATTSEAQAHRSTPADSISDPVARDRQPLAGDMATHIRVLKSQGGGEARLNLNPAELGRMSITVITEAGETKVAFVVETTNARYAIEAALPRLREMLEQAGLSLTDSDVAEERSDAERQSHLAESASSQNGLSTDDDSHGESLLMSVTLDPERILDTFA